MKLGGRFEDGWSLMPTKDLISELGRGRIVLGRQLATDGSVEDAYIMGKTLHATVVDSGGSVHVDISQDDDEVDCQCSCLMLHTYDCCEHVVAALVYLQNNFGRLMREAAYRKPHIAAMISATSPKDAADFLARTMLEDVKLYRKFMDEFGLRDVGVEVDPHFEMGMIYRAGLEGGETRDKLDFDKYFKAARGAKPPQSIEMCRVMLESVLENMERVDNSDGYYTDCIIESLDGMVEAALKVPSRKKHIEYMVGALTKTPPELAEHYRDALFSMCTTGADKKCMGEALGAVLDRTPASERTVALVLVQMRRLEDVGDEDGLLRLMEQSYRKGAALRSRYIGLLGKSGSRKAIWRVVKEFPMDAETTKAALEVWDADDPEYTKLLENAFASTGDWKYYNDIKEIDDEWMPYVLVEELLKNGKARRAVEVCMKEKLHADAMDVVESAKDLEIFMKYATRLAKKYPARYFNAYSSLVRQAVKDAGSVRSAKVRKHLSRLRVIAGKKYPEFLSTLEPENEKPKYPVFGLQG